jgi:putative ATP-dependent endonuclease of OLD family
MKLTKVRIQNFRSIRDLTIYPRSLCALVGSNNSGKSNIIRAINFILGERWPSVKSLDDYDFYGLSTEIDLTITAWFDSPLEVRGDVGEPVEFSGVSFRVSRYKRRSGTHDRGDLRSEFVCVDDSGVPLQVLRRPDPVKKPHPETATVTSAIRESLPAVFIDVDRSAAYHLSGNQWSILGRLLRDVSQKLKTDKERFAQFKERFNEARQVLRTPAFDELETKVVEHLRAHTGLPDVSIILDDVDPINIYRTFSVLFRDGTSPTSVDAERMGSGIQSAVVISLLQVYRELRKENALVLFEEPELFLHPHGRRHLYGLLCELADAGTQIIYTTHSQDLVDLSRMDDVLMVSSSSATGTTARQPAKAVLSDDGRSRLKLARHFGMPRNEIFFASSVILVEGVTEQAAIRLLAERMEPPLNLDRCDCSVIEAGSKTALPFMARVVKALGKRLLVVYDSDSSHELPADKAIDDKRNRDIEEIVSGWGRTFACDPDIEAVLGITKSSGRNKELRMREHLATNVGWEDFPERLRELLASVQRTATQADG